MTPRKVVDGQGRAEGARYPSLGRTGSPASTGVPSELVRWGGSLLAGAGSPRTTRPNIPRGLQAGSKITRTRYFRHPICRYAQPALQTKTAEARSPLPLPYLPLFLLCCCFCSAVVSEIGPDFSPDIDRQTRWRALAPGTCPLGHARPRHRRFAPAYFTTDWNSGDVSKLANWLSLDDYSPVSTPPVELISVASSAVFSSGVPCAFRSICTPFSSVEQVAAVIVSDIFTPNSNFTPLAKSMV